MKIKNLAELKITLVSIFVLIASPIQAQDQAAQKEESIKLFVEASKVFQHPRCLNCHPAGDTPTQGNDLHKHIMNVQRGPDDHGKVGMRCNACHGEMNNTYSNVPGAPKWALAPKSMAWQGLTVSQLCQTLKDPKKNHGMTMEKFIEHNAKDPLVGWGWNPGAGRVPVPGTQKQFGELIARWVATGAACPEAIK